MNFFQFLGETLTLFTVFYMVGLCLALPLFNIYETKQDKRR
jgi:hypothetical protein